jgi:hypothetical protein
MLIDLQFVATLEILRANRSDNTNVIWLEQLFVLLAGPESTVTLIFIVLSDVLIWWKPESKFPLWLSFISMNNHEIVFRLVLRRYYYVIILIQKLST